MPGRLLITADDYGYSPAYNRGILEAARAGAIDAASAMVMRPWCDPGPLLAARIEVGLHLESLATSSPADAEAVVDLQAERFRRLFGRDPAYLDGHHHCHADPPLERAVAALAGALGVRVRAVSGRHRGRLREEGLRCPDRLVGRISPEAPLLPPEIERLRRGAAPPEGLTEWMVHPGHPDPAPDSSYDTARAEDLAIVLELAADPKVSAARRGA